MLWTDGRKRAFITAVLRSGMRRWPPKYAALHNAYVTTKVNVKTNRLAKHYECNACKKHFTSKDVEVDHINPVVDPDVGFVSWDLFIERLYCKMENLQALCKNCHKVKTKEERTVRKDAKRISKESVPLCPPDSTDNGIPDSGSSGRGRGSSKRVRKSGA
jgi:5-methylcytosine-specific restriction endonuclease McrA